MKIKFLLISALIFAFSAIIFAQTGTASITGTDANRGYLIGPGDIVEGKIPGEEEFSFKSTVDDDGRIQIPYSSDGIPALCITEKQLRADVTKFWSKYLKNPQVSLSVTDRKSRQPVTVSGEVKTQQLVELRRQTRLLELISFSGGPTDDAGGMIQVFRPQPPVCASNDATANWRTDSSNGLDVPSRMYSLSSVKQGRDEANPIIYPGDVVIVQKASPVYITGEVRSPQGVYLKDGGLSLTQAIAQIGGVNRDAKTKDIKIYRLKPGSKDRDTIAVNYDLIRKGEQKDVMLEPYDVIEVDKAKKTIMQTVLEIAGGAVRTSAGGFANSLGPRVLY